MANWKKRTFEDGQAIVKQLEKSGLSQKRFAEKLGISLSALTYWVSRIRRYRQGTRQKSQVRFVEVIPKSVLNSQPSTLELPGGIILKTDKIPSPEYLGELCAEMQRWSSC